MTGGGYRTFQNVRFRPTAPPAMEGFFLQDLIFRRHALPAYLLARPSAPLCGEVRGNV